MGEIFNLRLAFIFVVSMLFAGMSFAQKYTVSGYVSDQSSGERLIGANVFDPVTQKGTTTNNYGFYSLTLEKDTYRLAFSYVGYRDTTVTFVLDKNKQYNLQLDPVLRLKEVEVVEKGPSQHEKIQMSTIDLPVEKVKSLPAFLGEKDVLKTMQLLPGVQSGNEGTSGLYIRGGSPDQNLILLDGVPVYNVSHLFGFFSVFNPGAIQKVKLIKGGFPARYGGRLSSVIDVRMKEGNRKEFGGEGSIGIISSKLTLEGPIQKNKTSFIVSGRRTYIDLLAKPFIAMANSANSGQNVNAGYYFYDLNAKVNHKLSENDQLYLSTYLGNDNFYTDFEGGGFFTGSNQTENKTEAGIGWGNITTALRWNRVWSNRLFSNTTLTFSRYRFKVGQEMETREANDDNKLLQRYKFEYLSGINDWAGKIDFDYLPGPNHYIRFGAGETYHTFSPGANHFLSENKEQDTKKDTVFGNQKVFAHEFNVYIEDDWRITSLLKANTGVHASGFLTGDKLFYSVQPRISARYLLSDEFSLKASYATMSQYIHLLSSTTIGLPTDLWMPATEKVVPEHSVQYAAGLAYSFPDNFEISLEGYYKEMDNVLGYKPGASLFTSGEGWESKVLQGQGWSYGAELFVRKNTGKTTGWLGYTLSWTQRRFDNLNFGESFPYRYDRRHDVSLAVTHRLNKNIEFSLVWVYGSGNAVTLPEVRYRAMPPQISGLIRFPSGPSQQTVTSFDSRNNFRMPAYHRLDLGVRFLKQKSWGKRIWNIGAYNAYNRKNPFFLYLSDDPGSNKQVLKQVSLFPILPYVSFELKF